MTKMIGALLGDKILGHQYYQRSSNSLKGSEKIRLSIITMAMKIKNAKAREQMMAGTYANDN